MPLHDLLCEKCDYTFEICVSMQSPIEGVCPQCQNLTNNRLMCVPMHVSSKNSNTLGSLAEKNRNSMGQALYEEKARLIKEDNENLSTYKGNNILNDGKPLGRTKIQRPSWRLDMATPDTKLLKGSPEAITKYIMEGKRPFGT